MPRIFGHSYMLNPGWVRDLANYASKQEISFVTITEYIIELFLRKLQNIQELKGAVAEFGPKTAMGLLNNNNNNRRCRYTFLLDR